jgi:hypothetical protein
MINCLRLSFKVTHYFIEFTSNGYWLFLALEDVLDRSVGNQSLCSIFPITIILTAMAYSCYQCAENAQHTGVLIHKIERDINNDLQNALVRTKLIDHLMIPKSFYVHRFASSRFKSFTSRLKSQPTDSSRLTSLYLEACRQQRLPIW